MEREVEVREDQREANITVAVTARGSGAYVSASWLCEHRHNYCVYKADLFYC